MLGVTCSLGAGQAATSSSNADAMGHCHVQREHQASTYHTSSRDQDCWLSCSKAQEGKSLSHKNQSFSKKLVAFSRTYWLPDNTCKRIVLIYHVYILRRYKRCSGSFSVFSNLSATCTCSIIHVYK